MKTIVKVVRGNVCNDKYRKDKLPIVADSKQDRFEHDDGKGESFGDSGRNDLHLMAARIDVIISIWGISIWSLMLAAVLAVSAVQVV